MFLSLPLLLALPSSTAEDLPECQIFQENKCEGDQIITPEEFENHRWFTPQRPLSSSHTSSNETEYLASFQDFAYLAGHAQVVYAKDRLSAKVTVHSTTKKKEDGEERSLTYVFDGKEQDSPSKQFSASSSKGSVSVSIQDDEGHVIDLEPIDFVWNAPAVRPLDENGDYRDGQKGAIVEMFMWPHMDVEKECAMLAKMGYMGVKLFPAQEQLMSTETFDNNLNPWYFAYQPVSYRLQGRMGTRDQLRSLIQTCRAEGVRVYADAVINHMTGGGNDANPKHRNPDAGCTTWGGKQSSLVMPGGSDGPSPMYTQNYIYSTSEVTGQPASQEFPAAHLGPTDFHCERPLNAWTDPLQLNAGWLSGLTDLNTEKENVQDRIAAYLTDLISIGFSGFRIDAAKHIQPDDLVLILTKLRDNLGGEMPEDWITYLEVLLGGEADLLMCDPDSGYNYGAYLENALLEAGWSQTDVNKVKIWNSGYPKEPQNGYCTISPTRNAIQNDDADQQNPGSSSRDMGDQGCVLVKGCPVEDHRGFETKLFESPNGASDNANDYPIRLILSSYYWQGDSAGVPDGYSDCSKCTKECETCRSTNLTAAYDASSCGYDSEVYTRPHRDIDIVNAMRTWMNLPTTSYEEVGLTC